MEKDIQFRKNFIWNILGTGLNSFNSLFFMIAVTRINGIDNAGIYTLAYSTACILYMIGIYAGRIYQVTENNKNITNKDYIANRSISCLLVCAMIIVFVLIKQYDMYKATVFIILAIYKALEAFGDVFYGILQKNDLLEKAGKSLFIKAIASLLLFIGLNWITGNLIIACLSIVIVHSTFIIFYDYRQSKKFIKQEEKVKVKNVINIFKGGFFPFIIAFLGVYMTNAQKYAIDGVLAENMQAIFGIIIMPATVMGLLAQFLIHPYLNKIFECYKANDYIQIKKILHKIILCIFVIGLLCSIAGFLVGTQVLGVIYNLDLSNYSLFLFIILIAATFYTMAGIISPILITMRCMISQFIIYALVSIFEFVFSNIFVANLGLDGAVYSYLITMVGYFVVFYVTSAIIIKRKMRLKEMEAK